MFGIKPLKTCVLQTRMSHCRCGKKLVRLLPVRLWLRLMSCLFPVPDYQYGDRVSPVAAVPIWNSLPQHINLLRNFLSSAVAWRHTTSNAVTRNYCCRAREVTLSFMDTLIAPYLLTYLLTHLLWRQHNGTTDSGSRSPSTTVDDIGDEITVVLGWQLLYTPKSNRRPY